MNIIEIRPEFRQDQKRFLQLPFRIYQGISQWVPPLAFEASRVFDQKKHPFYRNGEAAFFLALDQQGMPCGRLAALHNQKYNDFNHEKSAFFYLFECINDRNVAHALFDRAASWAKSRGLTRMIGPKGFSALDGLGLLVKGFEHRPAFGLPYNPPYYSELIEAEGFTPCGEIVSGYLDPKRMVLPEKIEKAAELIQKRRGMQLVRFNNRRELVKIIPELQKLYNDSLEGTTGNIPLTEADLRTMANQLLWFADPRLIKIIRKDGCFDWLSAGLPGYLRRGPALPGPSVPNRLVGFAAGDQAHALGQHQRCGDRGKIPGDGRDSLVIQGDV